MITTWNLPGVNLMTTDLKMQETEYMTDVSNKTYTIKINKEAGRGFFEHKRLSTTGTLLFEGQTLIDFDGVKLLPLDVLQQLEKSGFDVEAWM